MSETDPFVSSAAGVPDQDDSESGIYPIPSSSLQRLRREKRRRIVSSQRVENGFYRVQEESTGGRRGRPSRKRSRTYDDSPVPQEEPAQGEEDEEEEAKWETCRHPTNEAIFQMFGAPDPQDECWACMHGTVNSGTINIRRLNEMTMIFKRGVGYMPMHQIARELYDFFEKYIRKLTNESLQPGEQPIPEWRHATILEHMQEHSMEPSVTLITRLEQIHRIQNLIYDHGLFLTKKRPGTDEDGEQRFKLDEKAWKIYNQAMDQEHKLYNSRPGRMFLHNSNLDVSADMSNPWVNPSRSMFTATGVSRSRPHFLGGQ